MRIRINFILVFLVFGIVNGCFGQQKTIARYFKDYTQLDVGSDYPTNETDPRAMAIPSRTYAGDTSGLKFRNQFVAFRQDDINGVTGSKWHFRFLHNEPTTLAEYNEFRNQLRDSLLREQLYERVKDDKEAAKMLVVSKPFLAEMERNTENNPKDFGYKDRTDNRYYFDLNWKYPLIPEKGWQAELLSNYYLPEAERFYGKREFDWRNIQYSYFIIDLSKDVKTGDTLKRSKRRFIIDYESPVIVNPFAWSHASKSVNDETSVLGQLYEELLSDQPLTGITGMQALAFCDWKAIQIEKELEKQGVYAWVSVTLPTVSDLERLKSEQQFQVPERDYTKQWRIGVKEYKAFVNAVKDSLRLVTEEKLSDSSDHCYYRYFWMDAATKGFEPGLTPGPENVLYTEHYETVKGQNVESRPFGALNELGQHSGVRVFTNLQAFIIPEQVNVIAGVSLDNQEDTESMKGITYEQAKAFYSWKYPIHKAKQGDDWQQFIFPTKEQFESVQSGETVIVPAHKLDFPSPTFQYVVHVNKLR